MMEEKMTDKTMAQEIAELAASRVHNLSAYLVDGMHEPTPGQYRGIVAYLLGRPERAVEEDMGEPRTAGGRAAFTARHLPSSSPAETRDRAQRREHIEDIPQGFFATPSRTGNNDLDFWKVRVSEKTGFRSVARVVGGGDAKYPRLVEIGKQEQRAALGAILRTGIDKAREEYADKEKRCMKCGIQLTDETSRRFRMGPDCRGGR